MPTPNDKEMFKMAQIDIGKANVSRLIVSGLRFYSDLNDAIGDFISDPSEETAKTVDSCFLACSNRIESIRHALVDIAKVMNDEEGDQVSGTEDDNGVRLK